MNFSNLFSRKQVCRPLTNITGVHVEKYRSFRSLLSHNHAALNAISEMEQLYHSGKPFSLTTVKYLYEELLEGVFGVIHSLEAIRSHKYSALRSTVKEIDLFVREEAGRKSALLTRDLVLPFEQITPALRTMVGSKAANLAIINNTLGLPVPGGFAVTAYASDRFIEENNLSEPIARELSKISADSPAGVEGVCARIREMITNATVPEVIARKILQAYGALEEKKGDGVRIAMRSSAIGEDTEATFAGQYATVLNVGRDNLLDAYKTVLASKYTEKAIFYRLHYGLSDGDTPMCVAGIVMIDPRSSGVVYTANSLPGDFNTLRITALWGLGEQLVDGSASADMFTVDRKERTILKRELSRKEYRLVIPGSGSPELEQVPENEREVPSIDDGDIVRLCQYGVQLEELFGCPQDIEWAKDKRGDLFILQSRPLRLPAGIYEKSETQTELTSEEVLLAKGKTASPGIAAGKVYCVDHDNAVDNLPDGAILVARTASPDYAKVIGKAKGIITDIGSVACHLSSVAREFGVPAIVDAHDATSLLPHGETVTMSADTTTVYRGIVEALANRTSPAQKQIFESPVHQKMRRILDRISPLTLTDPKDPSFAPEGCQTLHDIIRFTHETAMKAMFGLTDEADEVRSVKLVATVPLTLRLIDLGGGLTNGLNTCQTVTPEHIESVPLAAIWKGFTHPGISWSGAVSLDLRTLMTLFSTSAASEFGETPGGTSYAIISGEYMNLSAKFGYHFATIDSFCSKDSTQNYASLQFSGGAGNYYGKSLRISFLGNVLKKLGFQIELKGDLLTAFLGGYDSSSLGERLDLLGRLLASSRLLDMALSGQNDVELLTNAFFREDYDFLAQKREDELKAFYTSGGYWKRLVEDGHVYCIQDGTHSGFGISSGVAGVMGKIVGQALQDFLDNIEAYYYFPLAIAKHSEISDGTVSARIRPVGGHIDRAGGIAFGIRNAGNYFVIRINAVEDNVILFEFVNNKRLERVVARERIQTATWYELKVDIRDGAIRGYLDNRQVIEYTAERTVKGFIGLWTKADSLTYFDALTIQTKGEKRNIPF